MIAGVPKRPRPRRSQEATFVCTRGWQKPRPWRYVKCARKRSGLKGSFSHIENLGLFPLLVYVVPMSKGLRVFGYVTEKNVHQGLSHHDTAPDMARAIT